MRTFNRFVWFSIFVGIIIVLTLTLGGCGSKKKTVQSSEYSAEIAKVERVKETKEAETKKEIKTESKSESHSITENSDVTLTQGDPDKEIILTDSQGRVTKIKGANAVISTRKETVRKKDTLYSEIKESAKEKTVTEKESDTAIEIKGKDKIINKQKDGRFPWWILILAAVLYLAVSYFRKTLNPIGWFT